MDPLIERLEQNGFEPILEKSTVRDELKVLVGDEVVFTGTVNEVSELFGGEKSVQRVVQAVKAKLGE